jgi:predicted polyphosphate/ATP-dependent NAD kinase
MGAIRLGLLVNPIAGMGGSVGLKGTDGGLAERARALGARPLAEGRAAAALAPLRAMTGLEILAAPGRMGENSARAAGFAPSVLPMPALEVTSGATTSDAARRLVGSAIDLLLFAGGDGTARDILPALAASTPLLGIPAGVKMHSAVFAATARTAGDVARCFLASRDRVALLADAEIMDRDPAEPERQSPRLYGFARTPRISFLVAQAKSAGLPGENAALDSAARWAAGLVRDGRISLIGPGSTMLRLKRFLGFEGSLGGVDVVSRGELLAGDANEAGILERIAGRPARILVSVVGGQGFLFGRGNQQLSARVIRQVGLDNIVVIASLEKLAGLPAQGLLVDTGDAELDDQLAGFRQVVVGEGRTVVFPVRNPAREMDAVLGQSPASRGAHGEGRDPVADTPGRRE